MQLSTARAACDDDAVQQVAPDVEVAEHAGIVFEAELRGIEPEVSTVFCVRETRPMYTKGSSANSAIASSTAPSTARAAFFFCSAAHQSSSALQQQLLQAGNGEHEHEHQHGHGACVAHIVLFERRVVGCEHQRHGGGARPPPVMVYTRSNTWNDQMVPSVTTRNVTLESPGSVILKKRWNALRRPPRPPRTGCVGYP